MLILLSFYELMYFMSALVSEFSKVNLKIKNTLLAKKKKRKLFGIYIHHLCNGHNINKLKYKLFELIRITKYLEL